jgi:release factor glutamine methyltransferase
MTLFYEPEADTLLIAKAIAHLDGFQPKTALDVGVGSGALSQVIQKKWPSCHVLGIDINDAALEHCQNLGLHVQKSDLFETISTKFNLIVCNPPYLPQNEHDDMTDAYTRALVGGKNGYEYILAFLEQAKQFLEENGKIVFLFSSLSNKSVIDTELYKSPYIVKFLTTEHVGLMEDLYVYELTLPKAYFVLQKPQFLAKGKRGLVLKGMSKKKVVVAKVPLDETQRIKILEKEALFLKRANESHIGPTYLMHTDHYILMEYVDGVHLRDYLKSATPMQKETVLVKIMHQCEKLDKAGIAKAEMTNPGKNILVTKTHKPVLIDFERASFTQKTKNANQFKEFIKRHS